MLAYVPNLTMRVLISVYFFKSLVLSRSHSPLFKGNFNMQFIVDLVGITSETISRVLSSIFSRSLLCFMMLAFDMFIINSLHHSVHYHLAFSFDNMRKTVDGVKLIAPVISRQACLSQRV